MQDQLVVGPINRLALENVGRSPDRLLSKIRTAQNAPAEKRNAELKRVAQEFESLFIAYLLKVMRETIQESGLTEAGVGKDIYTDLFDQEVSRDIARRGVLGLADLIVRKLSSQVPVESENSDGNSLGDTPASAHPSSSPDPSRNELPDKTSLEPEIPDFRLPIQAPISSGFGLRRDPFTQRVSFHKGLDLPAPEGMEVRAPREGKVIFSGSERGYGNTVIIEHSEGLQTRYAHLGIVKVKPGEVVSDQQVLGTVGSTGRSTGPHLHFEVIRWREWIDPRPSLAE